MPLHISSPFTPEAIQALRAGDEVLLSGVIYTGRDAAHKRMCALLDEGKPLPFDARGQAIYYAGPCPARPGRIIGAIGPTTSGRMDAYAPRLMEQGLLVMIGKGSRNAAVMEAIKKYGGVYLAAVGGAAALMSKCVTAAEAVAFEDLGTEAVRRLIVENMPLIVAADCAGGDVYAK